MGSNVEDGGEAMEVDEEGDAEAGLAPNDKLVSLPRVSFPAVATATHSGAVAFHTKTKVSKSTISSGDLLANDPLPPPIGPPAFSLLPSYSSFGQRDGELRMSRH